MQMSKYNTFSYGSEGVQLAFTQNLYFLDKYFTLQMLIKEKEVYKDEQDSFNSRSK